MKNKIGSRPNCRDLSFCLFVLLTVLSFIPSAQGSLIFLDDFQADGLDADITNVFRTPTVGPPLSAAWYQAVGPAKAQVVNRFDGKAAQVDVPQGCSLDYIERLGGTYGNRIFLISWDLEVAAINGGWGMFFVRFPTSDPPNSMQVLFGFIDDGRLVRFSGKPALDTLVSVGKFQAGTRYSVWLIYDLVSFRYSVSLNDVRVVDQESIPDHFALTGIDKFGFDINQKITLPDIPPSQGNTYYVDNVRFATLESIYLPILLKGN
jgi:hypothetical protein